MRRTVRDVGKILTGERDKKFGGGRTNLLEQLGRVEAEPSNPNRRAEISRVHGELNRGYAKGGRAGFSTGRRVGQVLKKSAEIIKEHLARKEAKKVQAGKDTIQKSEMGYAEGGRTGFREGKFGGAAKKRKIEQTKAVKRLTTSDKAYSPKKLIVEAFKRRGTKGAGTGTAKAITDWENISEAKKEVRARLPGSTVTVHPQEERVPRRGLGQKTSRSPSSPPPPQPKLSKPPLTPREAMMERKAEGGRTGFKKGTDRKWIQKAVDPKHKGYCTPMTKKTCTPARKALARTFKKKAKTGWGQWLQELKINLRTTNKGGHLN